MTFAINVVVSACMISLASWLSSRYPTTAGFMVAIPVSLLFFVLFLLSSKYPLSFWQAYGLGCIALPIGYVIHRSLTKLLF